MFEFLFKYSRSDFLRSELVFTGEWPLWLSVSLALLGLLGISLLFLRRRAHATPSQLLAIGILQLTMLLIVLVMLQQPALRTETLKPGENSVALVVDSSESMQNGVPESRFESALGLLAAVAADEDSLNLTFQHYEFSDTAKHLVALEESQPTGTVTSIADSLLAILDDARSSPLAAIILVSDGADTTGGVSADQLARIAAYGIPVHTIGVGREIVPEDIELNQVLLPSNALPASTVSARVAIRHDTAAVTRVKVYDGDELLASEAVELRPNSTASTAWVDIELRDAGHRELTFIVDGIPNETELRNNRRSALVNVGDQEHRILYFEGEPRWEYKFLRRAIDSDDKIKLASLLRVSPNKFYRQGLESPEHLENGFPTTRAELFAYDALIIGSVEAASFSPEQLEIIRDFVSERGGSLLMLAGPSGLGNGGWGQSTISALLPATLPPSTTDSFVRRKAKPVLTTQGADLQMLRLADTRDDNRRMWAELPDIADYQVTGNLKPAAIALLEVQTDRGTIPLLMTQPFGRGHTYILASGGTWRWQMSLPVEDQRHETFWQQFLRALVSSAPGKVSLSASTVDGDSAILLRAEFRDAEFEPVDDVRVSAVVSDSAGESWAIDVMPSPDEPGVFVAETTPTSSGTWFFEAIAERDGEPYANARASAYFESGQVEYFNFRANTALLRRLSEATGGQFLEPDGLDAITDLLRYASAGITEQVYRPVWDAPFAFFLLLLLKSGEWLLRRRWKTI